MYPVIQSAQSRYGGVPGTRQVSRATRNSTVLSSFSAAPELPASAQSGKKAAPPAEVGESASPAELYEQMTGRVVTEAENSGVSSQGTAWTDSMLARLAGIRTGEVVDTTEKINWESTGRHVLTAGEIASLREKYDVQNLTPQAYYNLMADLTQMDVLTVDDIQSMHVRPIPLNGILVRRDTPDMGSRLGGDKSFTSGSILEAIASAKGSVGGYADYLDTDEFRKYNPNADAKEVERYRNQAQEYMEHMEKLQTVFASIMR